MTPDVHKPQRIDKATPEQIEAWEKQYGDIAEITLMSETGETLVYMRRPRRYDMSLASREQHEQGGYSHVYDETLIKLCCLCGKAEDVIADEGAFNAVRTILIELVEVAMVSVKKHGSWQKKP